MFLRFDIEEEKEQTRVNMNDFWSGRVIRKGYFDGDCASCASNSYKCCCFDVCYSILSTDSQSMCQREVSLRVCSQDETTENQKSSVR